MGDREKENRDYEEFLKLYGERYGANREDEASAAAAASRPQQAMKEELQGDEAQENGLQVRRQSRRPSARRRRRRMVTVLSAIALAAVILIIIIIVRSCSGGTDVLKGTWDLDGVTVYQFDGKGAGSLNLPGDSYAFTYEIKDGTLVIDFESKAARDRTYAFTADESKLTLTDGEGEDSKIFELTKQND